MTVLELEKSSAKVEFFNPEDFETVYKQGFPSTYFKFGQDLDWLINGKIPVSVAARCNSIEYL